MMKTYLNTIIAVLAIFIAYSCTGPSRFTITTRLSTPLIVQPFRPGDGYIWIEGEWFWNGRTYTWRDGYWSLPLRGYIWTPGRWKQRSHGWHWTPGRWKR